MRTETFKEKFERVQDAVADEGIETGFDNVVGLILFDAMVDVVTQTPAVREYLHGIIRKVLSDVMEVEFEIEDDESMIGYM